MIEPANPKRFGKGARIRFGVEYLGTNYCGWQIQQNANSIQAELEKALGIAMHARTPICVVGAGRTDTGVHGRGQVVHADLPLNNEYTQKVLLELDRLTRALNGILPHDISVRGLGLAPDPFHARYSALTRRYCYRIARRPFPLESKTRWLHPQVLDEQRFREELNLFLGPHDFRALSVSRYEDKSTLCEIQMARLEIQDDLWLVHIEGNRFLHRMVRGMVGLCIEAAGNRNLSLTKSILQEPEKVAPPHLWAPAIGLCLEKVTYEDYDV